MQTFTEVPSQTADVPLVAAVHAVDFGTQLATPFAFVTQLRLTSAQSDRVSRSEPVSSLQRTAVSPSQLDASAAQLFVG